jgi:hypothetical protein
VSKPSFYKFFSVTAICLLPALAAEAGIPTILNWMSWNAPASYPGVNQSPLYNYTTSATGTITMPDGSIVNVILDGEVLATSCFSVTSAGCPDGVWKNWGGWGPSAIFPVGTFTSSNVPNVPPNANQISQAGYTNQKHVLTFSQPVTNIVMDVLSLGSPTKLSAYQFDQAFSMLSQNPNCNKATGAYCLTQKGKTLEGLEGAGSIQFTGTFTSISWTVTVPEFFSGFNIGVTSAVVQDVVVTADNSSSLYGVAPGTIGYTDIGFQGSDTYNSKPVCGAYTDNTYSTPVSATTPPGQYVTHCDSAEATGYQFTYVDGIYTIGTAAVTVTAQNNGSVYGASVASPITYTANGFVGSDSFSTVPVCGAYTDNTYMTPVTKTTRPGQYITHCANAQAANYSISYIDGVYTIAPAVVTITAQNNGSAFGAAPATITYTDTGFIGNDSFSTYPVCAAFTDSSYATPVTATTPPGTYVTHCSGAQASGYTISYIDGIYSISNQIVNGACGTAQGVFTTTAPATVDLCLSGTPGAAIQGADGNFTWTCSGTGGGSTASCSSANGKVNQSIILGPPLTTLKSGRGVTLTVKGGKGTGKVTYSVQSGSGTHCSLKQTSAKHVLVKTRGSASGTCTVVASKAGDALYNPATSNVATINVICPPTVSK